jgi:excisionase family DNA binding protein
LVARFAFKNFAVHLIVPPPFAQFRRDAGGTKSMKPIYGEIPSLDPSYGLKKTKIYELLGAKKIRAKKLGRKTLIEFASVDEYIASLPSFGEV